jgi:small subunit ribosomal protein S17
MTEQAKTTNRKLIVGTVISNKMDKTVIVEVSRLTKHPKYGKYYRVTKTYKVHDEKKEAKVGDTIQMIEGRPISKQKRFRLQKIVERAKADSSLVVEV